MRRDDVNEVGLAILAVVAILLVADNVWLHIKCTRQAEALTAQSAEFAALQEKVELHLNPPPAPSVADRVKETYQKAKSAAARQYEAVKEKFGGK